MFPIHLKVFVFEMSSKDFARMGNRVVSGEWRAQQLKLPKELESR